MRYTRRMASTKRTGRPRGGDDVRLVVRISPRLDAALDARVAELTAASGESHDRSRVVRALLSQALRDQLRAAS